ncbi:pyridoxamine 5'-phosphate oxidase family protein [Altererythrobacter sp. Z27]|uniref:pyridoxamine 5'-phosphate oxidase family protein n=1 Tax=Altererythrobacter sp. Z27 TaxID=3461147 RepID=UPI004044D96F
MIRETQKISSMLDSALRSSVLCWLATVNTEGQPNVSPKELFCRAGDMSLLIANVASPMSVANIRSNPLVCVSMIDVFAQLGAKFVGRARIVRSSDPEFGLLSPPLLRMAGPNFPVHALIKIDVESAAPIRAPSYSIFPERSIEEQIERAYVRYGVARSAS